MSSQYTAAPAPSAPAPGMVASGASTWVGVRLLAVMPISLAIAALCLALGWLSFVWGPPGLHRAVLWHMGSNGALSLAEPERLVANVFLHSGQNHLFNNVLALLMFGSLIEPTLGARRFLILYALGGLLGSVAMLVLHPEAASLGASGAIWALMTAELRLDTSAARKQWALPEVRIASRLISHETQRVFRIIGLVLFAILLNSGAHTGVMAHVTGGLVGLVLAPVLQRWERVPADAASSVVVRRRSWLSISAAFAAAAMLASIGLALVGGRAWELDQAPTLERVHLAGTPFSLELPALVAHDAHDISEKPNAGVRNFYFGESGASPITWSFIAYETSLSTPREEYFAQMLEREQQAPAPGWKPLGPIALVTVGTREAVRAERRHADGREKVSYEMLVGPYQVWLMAHREGPAVWGDIEERVAASLGMLRD
jgi:membrane associated rhomboid family serine protease